MLSCMDRLKHGQAVSIPNYDINSRKRTAEPSRQVLIYTKLIVRPISDFKIQKIKALWRDFSTFLHLLEYTI